MLPDSSQLEPLLSQWERDQTLLEPSNFAQRLEILYKLDAALPASSSSQFLSRTRLLTSRFEQLNAALYNSIRRQIQTGACPVEFLTILRDMTTAPRGLSYDYLDDLIAGVLQFEPPEKEPRPLDPDSVFYQPTPARHIFHLITAASITPADTLIDLGSGLGHVPLLARICTGATSIGIELDPAWNACAAKCADTLRLTSIFFLTADAREADLSSGTVFYLYTPFTGSTLDSVLDSLRQHASLRKIRVCTFGPCTLAIARQPWLRATSLPHPEQITIFHSSW